MPHSLSLEMLPVTQLPGESNKAYEAFKLYLNMADERSIKAVSQKVKQTELYVRQWSSKFKWKERIKTANFEQLQRERAAEDLAANALAEMRVRRKAQLEKNAWELYEAFVVKLREMAKFPVATREVITKEVKSKDGKTIHQEITVWKAPRWTFDGSARMMAIADAIGRMSLGLPVGKHELTGANGESLIPVAAQPIFHVTLEHDDKSEAAKKLVGEPAHGRQRGDIGLNGG